MKIYKLFVRPESGQGCAVLEFEGVLLRSAWLSAEQTAELERNPQGMKSLDYARENQISPEFLRGWRNLVTVFAAAEMPSSE